MLDLTRDTASDVQFGTYGDTCLANLTLVFDISGVDSGTRCANFCAEGVGEVEEELEVFLATHTIATGYDDGGVLDVYFALLDVAIDDFYNEIGVVDIFLGIEIHYFAFVVGVGGAYCGAASDSCGVRPVFGLVG